MPVQVRAGLPYATDFETAEGYEPGSLTGQGGWSVPSGDAALTTTASYHGASGVVLRPATPVTRAALSLAPSPGAPSPVVFTDLYVKPIAAATPEAGLVLEASGARVAFVLAGDHGELRVFQGDTFGGGSWQATEMPAMIPLNASRQAADWVRLTLRQDFAAKIWDLSVNGALVAINLRFTANTIEDFADLTLHGQSAGAVQADYLMIGFEHPLFPDADRDGMSDAYELLNGLNPDFNDREGDKDGDELTNIREFMFGLRADKISTFDDEFYDVDRVDLHLSLTGPTVDKIPPTAPTHLIVTKVTTDSIALSWAPATDNLGVGGYQVLRDEAPLYPEPPVRETAFLDQNLPQNTEFTYQVRAHDYAGNLSPLSERITVRTAAEDLDGNGLPDDWERQNFGRTGVDPNDDPDGDGLTNMQEYLAGTHPRDFYNGVEPIHDVLYDGHPGPDDQLAMIVRKPDGTPWPNAPVNFDITSGRRRVSVTKGGPDYQFSVVVRADANGLAQCYLEPLKKR